MIRSSLHVLSRRLVFALAVVVFACIPPEAWTASDLLPQVSNPISFETSAAVAGCPNAWDRFWADDTSCVDHGAEGDQRTCCYWEDDELMGCCHTAAT